MQLRDLLRERLANALHFLQRAGLDALGEFAFAERLDHPRAGLVGAGLEGILPLQLQQGADLGQNGGNLGFVHREKENTKERRSKVS